MSLIAIDLGTSFIKGAILNLNTLQIEHVRRMPFPEPLPGLSPLFREYDPYQIIEVVHALLHQLAPFAGDAEGLVMCTQMHGVVLTTEKGQPRSNLTTWQDQRVLMPHPSGTGTYFDVMQERLSNENVRQLGNELRPGLPIGLFFWWAEQGQLPGNDLIPADLAHFVLAHLCGSTPKIEATNGMAHGLLHIETLEWHYEVIDKLGLQKLRLPEVALQTEVVTWLPFGDRKIPCYPAIGDYQCALLGSLIQDGELSLNISTGSQVSLLKAKAEFGDFQTRPFFDGQYSNTITHIPAGRALNALVKLFSELATAHDFIIDNPWLYIAEQAVGAAGSRLKVDLAFYASASGDQGAITAIQEDEMTIGHIFRAAFQNMSDNYYAFAQRLSPEKSWQNLVFSGGLVQKIDLLRQMICDLFNVPYRLSPTAEDTLLGLLALGLACTGRANSVTEAAAQLATVYDRTVSG
jgi:sugar (pentulose or hexulose) kinase